MTLRVSTYVARDSLVHACPAGAKILLLLAFSIALFLVDTWWGMLVFAALAVLSAAASRIAPATYLKPLIPVYVLMAFTVAFNWLVPGLFYALRIFLLAFGSLIVCFTTTPVALSKAFSVALLPLGKIGLPVRDVSTTLSLSLRFMPMMAQEAQKVRDAQWSRGAKFDDGTLWNRLSAWAAVFIPLFVGMFRKADKLAVAMDARCYGATPRPCELNDSRPNVLCCVVCIMAMAAVLTVGCLL